MSVSEKSNVPVKRYKNHSVVGVGTHGVTSEPMSSSGQYGHRKWDRQTYGMKGGLEGEEEEEETGRRTRRKEERSGGRGGHLEHSQGECIMPKPLIGY